jgi:hypothetical protein
MPTAIEAEWFGLREDRFYRATIPLDASQWQELFVVGSSSQLPNSSPVRDRLVVGFAPSGHIAVWAAGASSSVLVTSAAGQVVTPAWSTRFPSSPLSRDEFISLNLQELGLSPTVPPMPARADLWLRAERRLSLRLLTAGIAELQLLSIRSANGEFAIVSPGAALLGQGEMRPIPAVIEVQWRGHDGVRRFARLELSMLESLRVVERLVGMETASKPRRLTLALDLSEAPRTATVTLASDSEIVPLAEVSLQFTRLP